MLQQMESAVDDGRLPKHVPVVILANHDKEEMDAEIEGALAGNKIDVYTRAGNPTIFSGIPAERALQTAQLCSKETY